MKKLTLLVMMFVSLSILSANILDPRFIARVWFDESDECFVMFGDEAWWEGFAVNDCCFTTSAGSYYLPPSYLQPSESVFVINLNQEIPDFTIQRNEDFLRLTNRTFQDFIPRSYAGVPRTTPASKCTPSNLGNLQYIYLLDNTSFRVCTQTLLLGPRTTRFMAQTRIILPPPIP